MAANWNATTSKCAANLDAASAEYPTGRRCRSCQTIDLIHSFLNHTSSQVNQLHLTGLEDLTSLHHLVRSDHARWR
jgi:hypothetical protein